MDRRKPTLDRTPSGALTLDGADLSALGPTPFWAYGADTIRRRVARLATGLGLDRARIHYAVKANDHLAILGLMAGCGLGADVVSGGELARARRAGIPADRIVFSGVGKTEAELALALDEGIGQINVESLAELRTLADLAAATNRVAPVGLRVNPDVDAGTHTKISTGRVGDKFGIALDEVEAAWAEGAARPSLRLRGLAFHIGSQVMDAAPFRAASERVRDLIGRLRDAGHTVDAVDCGGGLGIGYRDDEADADPAAFGAVLHEVFGDARVALSVEPGRWLVGPAGVLVASAVRTKEATPHPFLVLDAAMNDLLRPALYDAWHAVVPLARRGNDGPLARRGNDGPLARRGEDAPLVVQEVVGPVCESSDVLASARALPRFAPGEKVAILDAGAYGAVMSSLYNARPLAACYLVDGGVVHTIRPAMTTEQMWRDERIPGEDATPATGA